MPIFEYKCPECGMKFEELVLSESESVPCPKCGSDKVERLMSAFASSGSSGGSSCSAPSGSGFG